MSFGYKIIHNSVDITRVTYAVVQQNERLLCELLRIALFDFWIANEDRNYNNSNLMYDVLASSLISIDYGCILNTSTFDFPLSQLTSTDTILYANIFQHLKHNIPSEKIYDCTHCLSLEYKDMIGSCLDKLNYILSIIPPDWLINLDLVKSKLLQLFEKTWIDEVWNNFMECLKENLKNE